MSPVLDDGQLVRSRERENGKPKKTKAAKFAIFWSVRARRLSRAEAEAPAQASAPEPASEDAPF